MTKFKEALAYAIARGRKAIGASLGALTSEAVVRLGKEWFDVSVDPSLAWVIAVFGAAAGAWLARENAPKKSKSSE